MANFKEGERVYSFDIDGEVVFGNIYKNKLYPNVSEWFIKYDDGEEFAVLDINFVFKAEHIHTTEHPFIVAEVREYLDQLLNEEITFSRFVELLNTRPKMKEK